MTPEIPGIASATEIGRGAFGVVYRARQEAFDREVAVKVLMVAGLDEKQGERFRRELAAMGKVSWHPNIVTVYSAGLTEDRAPYIVMEYLPGGSLAERLRTNGVLPIAAVLDIGVKLASALETAHRAGILHRDVKPENILVSRFGDPKLSDFGIAQVQGLHGTRTGVTHLSVAHAPPELLNAGESTAAGDVYALSSTLCTLLVGHAPFVVGENDPIGAVMNRILTAPPPDLRKQGIADSAAAPLEAALAKSPADRPPSALAFAELLCAAQVAAGLVPTTILVDREDAPAAVAGERPAGGLPPPPLPILMPSVPPPPPPGSEAETVAMTLPPTIHARAVEPPRRSRRGLVAALAAVALLLVAGGVAFLLTRGPSPSTNNIANTGGGSSGPSPTTNGPTATPTAPPTPTATPAPQPPTFLVTLASTQESDKPSDRGLANLNGTAYPSSLIFYAGGYGGSHNYDTVYNIPGTFSQFTATIGLTDHVGASCGQTGAATFEIKVDGIIKYRADVPQGVFKPIQLPLTGAQQLELVSIVSGSNTSSSLSCDGVWGNAELVP